jgi:riboflavin synthase
MFTGIIRDIGEIIAIDKQGDWTITIKTNVLSLGKTAIGASIACSGVCLTVIEKAVHQFKVQVSHETLSKTTAIHWRVGTAVNLEPALCMGDELGGHLLSGHVDGLIRVVERSASADSVRFVFEAPKAYMKYIAPKGSISIDGISLTINSVDDVRFSVNIIPHTQQMTTIGKLAVGDEANFEIDMIARYVERMIGARIPA